MELEVKQLLQAGRASVYPPENSVNFWAVRPGGAETAPVPVPKIPVHANLWPKVS